MPGHLAPRLAPPPSPVRIILSPNIIQGTQYYELGMVLRHCPDLVRGRRMLRGWVITLCFVSADLTAVV